MQEYIIRDYQKGFEQEQARIGIEVAREWVWPFAYSADDLVRIHSHPDFDPETRHYCFRGDAMVGYMFSTLLPSTERGTLKAYLDFPRMLPGHEQAAELLIRKALETLKKKGVSVVEARVTTMWEGNAELAERMGFSVSEKDGWGHKVYYAYDLDLGKLQIRADNVREVDPVDELDECASLAAIWYKRPQEWCRQRLEEWLATEDIVAHLAVRDEGKMVAACLAAPNSVQTETLVGIYYIYAQEARYLRPLLAGVISDCVDRGYKTLLADLINEHRRYEDTYQALRFVKVAEWARCEKPLTDALAFPE